MFTPAEMISTSYNNHHHTPIPYQKQFKNFLIPRSAYPSLRSKLMRFKLKYYKLRKANRSRDGKTFGPLDQYPRVDRRLPNRERKSKSNFPFPSMRQVIFSTLLFCKFCQPRSYKIEQLLHTPQLTSIKKQKNKKT